MKRALSLLLCTSPLLGLEFDPWFNPPLEFHLIPAYVYGQGYKVYSPAGNFDDFGYSHWVECNLEVSPWPNWDVQLQVEAADTDQTAFTFVGGTACIRYNWMDDTVGNPFSLTTGVMFTGIRNVYIQEDSFYFNGHFNTEIGASIGRACYQCQSDLWKQRAWLYAGFGIAEIGAPWFNSFLEWDLRLSETIVWEWQMNFLFNFASDNYLANVPFPGYANLGYKVINLSTDFVFELPNVGELTLYALYNIYGSNTTAYYWTTAIQLDIPFSF